MSTIVFLIGLVNLFLAAFGAVKIPRQYFFKHYFVLLSFVTAVWLFANFVQIRYFSLFWLRTSYSLGALMMSSALAVTLSFSQQRKLTASQKYLLSGISMLFFSLCYVDRVFFRDIQPPPVNATQVSSFYAPYFTAYSVYFVATLLFILYKLFYCSRSFSGTKQKQARAILLGMLLFGTYSFTCSFLLPTLGYSDWINMDVAGSLFFVGFVAYAIFRYQFMNITIIVRRSTLHGVMVIFITGVYLASILLIENLFRGVIRYNSLLARMVAAVIIAFTFLPLRNRVEKFVDRAFFQTRYDYSQTLINFSKKLVTILELRDLLGTIVENIHQILQVEHVALLIYDKKSGEFRSKSSAGHENGIRDVSFSALDPLVIWLKSRINEHDQIAIRSALGEEEETQRETLIGQIDRIKAELCIPLFFQEQLIGILAIGEKESGERYNSDDLRLLRTLANHAATALANSFSYDDLKKSYLGTIEALVKAVEAKDEYTRGHSERVVQIATEIAKEMNLSREEINILRYAGMLHDIGKIAISDDILKKASLLDDVEQRLMMKHPVVGEDIIASIDFLQEVRTIIRHHHERWDGDGYPNRLHDKDIPLLSRILCIADAYDAMTSARSYRPPLKVETALAELKTNAGTQFDPNIVETFFQTFQKGFIS